MRGDVITLPEGFTQKVLAKWGDPLGNKLVFGAHADYTAYIPFNADAPTEGWLWVNHEYMDPQFVSGFQKGMVRTREQVIKEMDAVGGSIVHIRRQADGQWHLVADSNENRRFTGATDIPFAWSEPIEGATSGMGTLANCAGGLTPWGTFLTCEENYDLFWGERKSDGAIKASLYGWEAFFSAPPEHYGWVVEINPTTKLARKLVALGRFAHESATVVALPDGRAVVYSGDDANDQCLYKFISSKSNDLSEGTLYVADLTKGEWLSLEYAAQPALKQAFKSQTEVLVRCRQAADLLGGTKLDRPEDIEIQPGTGDVIVSLTNNKPKGNFYGSLLRLRELDGHAGKRFESSTFLAGGPETGFACPDNLAFDRKGNLWMTSDMYGGDMKNPKLEPFGNNGLFYIPLSGPEAGKVLQVASAPMDAEFTGPTFLTDGETLLVCVQHPGELTTDIANPTSRWPNGGSDLPRSAVVAISGPALKQLLA